MVKRIIKFSATWCAPCRIYADTFKKVSEMEQFKDIEFSTLDVEDDEADVWVQKLGIRNVPTTVILDDKDEVIYKVAGNIKENVLVDVINDAINK